MKAICDMLTGYLGTCEPDGQGGYCGRLIGVEPAVEYQGATRRAFKAAIHSAVLAYWDECWAAGREPITPPEPYYLATGLDIAWEGVLRPEPQVAVVVACYSLPEAFLRGRDEYGTARTMSGWCLLSDRRNLDELRKVGEATVEFLNRYGWHPCPSWGAR